MVYHLSAQSQRAYIRTYGFLGSPQLQIVTKAKPFECKPREGLDFRRSSTSKKIKKNQNQNQNPINLENQNPYVVMYAKMDESLLSNL